MITIVSKDKKWNVPLCKLEEVSKTVSVMYSGKFKKEDYLDLSEFDNHIIEMILKFIETGKISPTISEEDLIQLRDLADYLQLDILLDRIDPKKKAKVIYLKGFINQEDYESLEITQEDPLSFSSEVTKIIEKMDIKLEKGDVIKMYKNMSLYDDQRHDGILIWDGECCISLDYEEGSDYASIPTNLPVINKFPVNYWKGIIPDDLVTFYHKPFLVEIAENGTGLDDKIILSAINTIFGKVGLIIFREVESRLSDLEWIFYYMNKRSTCIWKILDWKDFKVDLSDFLEEVESYEIEKAKSLISVFRITIGGIKEGVEDEFRKIDIEEITKKRDSILKAIHENLEEKGLKEQDPILFLQL